MFIIFFLIFVFVFSIYENFFVWLIFLFICLTFVFLFNFFLKKIDIQLYVVKLIFAFLISMFCVLKFNFDFDNLKQNNSINNTTWVVLQKLSDKSYSFEIWKNQQYILFSKNDYFVWDILFVYWKIKYIESNFDFFSFYFEKINLRKQDYNSYLFMKKYFWTIYEQKSFKIGENQLWVVQKTRNYLKNSLIKTYWENTYSAILNWFLIWDKSMIEERLYDKIVKSWIVHILVVSWWNISILFGVLMILLFFIPFYLRVWVILSLIIFYSMICWTDSSVLRWTLMWVISYFSIFWWINIHISKLLKICIFLMLALNPYFLVYDVWFLLSFWAIYWIIYFLHILENFEIDTKSMFKTIIFSTIWASIWTFFILIFFFWVFNIFSLIANILVIPLCSFIIILWFLNILFVNFLNFWIWVYLIKFMLDYIIFVSEISSKYWIYYIVETLYFKILIIFVILFFLWLIEYVNNPKNLIFEK